MATRKSRPRRQPEQERAHDTVNVLLTATERVARSVGFEKATTAEIAVVAGVSIGTLYRYFPSKDALLAALVQKQWHDGLQWLGERVGTMRTGSFEHLVEDVVLTTFDMIRGRIEALGSMQIESDQVLHIGADLIETAARFIEAALERRRAWLRITDLRVASLIVVRSVAFLTRVGVRDYADLVAAGRYQREVADMVKCYLLAASPPPEGGTAPA